jgi:hypothetical protein
MLLALPAFLKYNGATEVGNQAFKTNLVRKLKIIGVYKTAARSNGREAWTIWKLKK